MKQTPCGNYVLYPLGSILVLRSLTEQNKQSFLRGHTSEIACVAMTADGSRLASGQWNHAGVKADVCVWDMERAKQNCDAGRPNGGGDLIHRLRQHLGKVQALDFRCTARH
ncbi:unnamed protein product, partial [Discosporangium mesarthrocarpum]